MVILILKRRAARVLLVVVALAVALTVITAGPAAAQCPTRTVPTSRPACPGDTEFDPGQQLCRGGGGWPAPRSHCRIADCNTCRGTETLDPVRGLCTRTVTIVLGRPACPPDLDFVAESRTCRSRGGWPQPRHHCRIANCNTCTEGESLDAASGLCCSPP